jgi:KaiC/GvpD/RAD55 family RecA-like ATPase
VESVGQGALTLQTNDGRHVQVDTNSVDRGTLGGVRPGDIVTVTGNAGTGPDRFSATALTKTK